jgi:truncated hemoglobin YjbI
MSTHAGTTGSTSTDMLKPNSKTIMSSPSFHEKIGGDVFLEVLLCQFFENLYNNKDSKHFFMKTPKETIKTHHMKFFRMLFGPDHMKPNMNKIFDYLLVTHSVMFRNGGLNETHFDHVAQCFIQTMDGLFMDQSLIDECVTILVPYRAVFTYGAQLAMKEKEMTMDEIKVLPTACSARMIETDTKAVLPTHPISTIPDWLLQELQDVSDNTTTVRDWTSNFADRFTAYGDGIVGDTLFDIPFYQYETYLATFMQLAFLTMKKDDADDKDRIVHEVLHVIQHPPGPMKPILPLVLYDRMIKQFELTCIDMNVNDINRTLLIENLKHYRCKFENVNPTRINGIRSLHSLSLTLIQSNQTQTSVVQSLEHDEKCSNSNTSSDMSNTNHHTLSCSNSSNNDSQSTTTIDDVDAKSSSTNNCSTSTTTTEKVEIQNKQQSSSKKPSKLSWIERGLRKILRLHKQ